MKQTTPITIGIEAWLEQVLAGHDAVVVSSSAMNRGFVAPECMNSPRIDRSESPVDAVLKASGRSWGGQRVALVLEGQGIADAIPSLASMQESGRDLTVVLWPEPADLARVIRGLLDAELTTLAAGSMQETLDLSAAASRIAAASGRPCLVVGSSREGAWSMGRFETVETGPDHTDAPAGPDSNRVDPFSPQSIGLPMTGRMVLKQQAARLAAAADLDVLIEESLAITSAGTGRPLSAFTGSLSSAARLIVPACVAPPISLSGSCLRLTQLFPLSDALTNTKPASLRPAVLLPAGTGSDMRHPLVRAFDSVLGSHERRSSRLFRRSTREIGVRAPLTVLVDPDIRWSSEHIGAITNALDEPESDSDLRFLDAGLAVETRVPAIEEAVHAARSAGHDPSLLDLSVPDQSSEEPALLIGARHPHAALELTLRTLERAEAGAVAAPVSMDSGGDALVFVRVTGMATHHGRSRVLLPDPNLIGHRTLRHHLPDVADILVPETTSGQLPRWMTEQDRSLFIVAHETDWLDGAFEAIPTQESNAIRACTEDDLLDAGARPPEELHLGGASSSSREHFLRTLGHLQDMDRLDEAPADEWILAGRTPSLVPRPNRWQDEARPLPTVIPDKCSGYGACWSVCPESAITSRTFSIAALMNAASDAAPGPFVHLPRLMSAWISTTHGILKKDDLGQFRNAGDLLNESLDRLLESAGVAESKAAAIRTEAATVIERVHHQALIRTQYWFDDRENETVGSGLLLSLQTDPSTCTHCGLCAEACPEKAIEEQADGTVGGAFRQLDALPTFESERVPTEVSGQPGSLLTGPSASAAFRAGSNDRANLNRTVIRLAVEAQTAAMRTRSDRIVQAILEGLGTLESAMQETAQDRIRINDFDSFGRELESTAGDVSKVLQTLLNTSNESTDAPLSDLAAVHQRLSRIRDDFNANEATGPALCIVNSLVDRSDGLAPFPSNPFASSVVFLPPEQAVSVIPGLVSAWRHRLVETALVLRQVRQLVDGTFESSSADASTAEDHAWARAHLPRILWIVDRCEHATLAPLNAGLPLHLCWIDGGPTLETARGLRPAQVRMLLPQLALKSTHPADPVALLETCEHLSSHEQAILHAYTPDPARDGVPVPELTDLIGMAGSAGLYGDTSSPSASLADWMVRQDRFQSRFESISRTDWSSDQVRVVDWLIMDDKARSRVQPCVVAGSGKTERRWIPDEAVLLRSEQWWRSLEHPAVEDHPQTEAASPQDPPSEPAPSVQPEPEPDAHARLTERLLALSGFQSGGTSLKAWLDAQKVDSGTALEPQPGTDAE